MCRSVRARCRQEHDEVWSGLANVSTVTLGRLTRPRTTSSDLPIGRHRRQCGSQRIGNAGTPDAGGRQPCR